MSFLIHRKFLLYFFLSRLCSVALKLVYYMHDDGYLAVGAFVMWMHLKVKSFERNMKAHFVYEESIN